MFFPCVLYYITIQYTSMNSKIKIPVGKFTQKRRPVSPVQTFEALQPENMGIGYRQSIDRKKEED